MAEQTLTATLAQHTGEGVFIVKSVEAECRPFRIDGVLQLLLCALME